MIGPTGGHRHATILGDRTGPIMGRYSTPVHQWSPPKFAHTFGGTGLISEQGKMSDMSYPSRPRRDPLREFAGQRGRWLPPGSTLRLTRFVVEEYNDGRSLREISELVDRSHREVANILDTAGVPRRPVGAAQVRQSTHQVREPASLPSPRAL